jgi:hypothetical protein
VYKIKREDKNDSRVAWAKYGHGANQVSTLPTFLKPLFNHVLNVLERSFENKSCSP